WLLTRRGAMRLDAGDAEGAGEDLSRAAALAPDDEEARVLLAEDRLFEGDASRAAAALPARRPERADLRLAWSFVRALALRRLSGRADAAAELTDAWRDRDARVRVRGPRDARSEAALAALRRAAPDDFAAQAGRIVARWPPEPAAALSGLLVDVLPSSERAWELRAETLARAGRRTQAQAALKRAVSLVRTEEQGLSLAELFLRQGSPAAALGLLSSRRDAGARIARARALLALGRRAEALAELAAARRLPRDPAARLELAGAYADAGESAAALEILRPLSSGDFAVRLARARLLARLGRKPDALAELDRARRPDLDRPKLLDLADAYAGAGEPARALDLLAGLTPDAKSSVKEASFLVRLGRKDDAAARLDRALAERPDPARRYEIATMEQDLGRYAAALKALAPLLEKRPNDPDLLNTRAICEYLSGDPKAAAASLERALRARPDYLPAVLTLGSIETDRKRGCDALALYESALSRTAGLKPPPPLRPQVEDAARRLRARLGGAAACGRRPSGN
ncbi:MAG: tetratricopeptide repeat protein, partial [Elusimicrobia bacterium]|nr:tetratricopeptide repeat protein [Elusimicrobiota bacterium]